MKPVNKVLLILIGIVLSYWAVLIYAADTELINLTELPIGNADVLLYGVYDVNGVIGDYRIPHGELMAYWPGSTAVTTLGTIGTGTWNATTIDEAKMDWTVTGQAIDFSGTTVALPARQASGDQHYTFNIVNPNAVYTLDTQVCIDPNTDAAMTITEIEVTCDADPTTELDFDLKFADAFIGLANATLIVAMDTTNGAASIAAFDDATVPAGKCVYIEFGAEPDSNITQVCIKVTWDYD